MGRKSGKKHHTSRTLLINAEGDTYDPTEHQSLKKVFEKFSYHEHQCSQSEKNHVGTQIPEPEKKPNILHKFTFQKIYPSHLTFQNVVVPSKIAFHSPHITPEEVVSKYGRGKPAIILEKQEERDKIEVEANESEIVYPKAAWKTSIAPKTITLWKRKLSNDRHHVEEIQDTEKKPHEESYYLRRVQNLTESRPSSETSEIEELIARLLKNQESRRKKGLPENDEIQFWDEILGCYRNIHCSSISLCTYEVDSERDDDFGDHDAYQGILTNKEKSCKFSYQL